MKIRDIAEVIERYAPLRLQESYDNAGLIVGRPEDEVHQALLAVDVTEEVLDEAERLTGGSSALTYLRKLYTELAQAGYGAYIRFDMGLVHQIDYYTGVVFRGYVEGAGDAVLSGGRYDRLVEAFGRRAPATLSSCSR